MTPDDDYRYSHMDRGGEYDKNIFSSPFDAYMDKWEGHHLEEALARLFPAKIPRYLDFACGTGRITQRVEARAIEAVGVDISESMLNAARSKCRTTKFLCVDLTRSAVDLGMFDLATSFRFFGNAQDELRSAVLMKIHGLLRPGGYLIINNHRNPLSFLGARRSRGANQMDLTYAKLKDLLIRHGFEILDQRAIGFWIFRFKLTTRRVLESPYAARLERAFQHPWLAPFSLDALLVARKVTAVVGR